MPPGSIIIVGRECRKRKKEVAGAGSQRCRVPTVPGPNGAGSQRYRVPTVPGPNGANQSTARI